MKLQTYYHQIPVSMQKHPLLSWEKFPTLLHPPKLYEASRCTLCGLIPSMRYLNINCYIRQQGDCQSRRMQKIISQNYFRYLATNWSCKCCKAYITIQTPYITVHHCLLTLSWPKSMLRNANKLFKLAREHKQQQAGITKQQIREGKDSLTQIQ